MVFQYMHGASDSDLTVVQAFLDRCFRRHYVSYYINIRELLEVNDKKLYNKCISDIEHPLIQVFLSLLGHLGA